MKIISYILLIVILNENAFSQNWLQQRIISDQFDKALLHYDDGRFATADNILQRILSKPSGEYELPINLLAMKTSLALDNVDAAKVYGKMILTQHGQHAYMSETFMVLGDIFIAEGDMDGAFRMYMRSRQLTDRAEIDKIDTRLISAIQVGIPQRTIAEQKLTTMGDNETVLNLAQSFTHLQKGNPDACAFALSKIDPAIIPEAYFELYEKLLLASYQPPMETFTFGVVLALTGKNAPDGTSFLQGLHQSTTRPNQTVKIAYQVEDTQSDPLEMVKAIKRLEKNRSLLGIIASLDDHESFAAVNSLQNSAIPLIVPGGGAMSFTNVSNHVFQLKSDWTAQGRMAAHWISEYLDKDSVAVLVPSDEFGNALVDEFMKEMDALDKTVVAVERYSGKPENVKKQFQALRQIAFNLIPPENPYDEFLGMSFDSLDALFDVNTDDFFALSDDKNEETIKDSSKVVLSTIQALYIPIHAEHLKYIGTQLPMYNLNTSLVGNLAWNQPEILFQDNVGPHLEGMTIISQKNAINQKDFPNQNQDDEYLLGYDMSGLILAICNSGITNRTEFINKLEQTDFNGLMYNIVFSPDEHSNSSMQILKCENRSFIPFGTFSSDTVQFHIEQHP